MYHKSLSEKRTLFTICRTLSKICTWNSLDLLLSVLGSDVVYSEGGVVDLLETLAQLSGPNTTIFLAGELRNGKEINLFSSCMDLNPYHNCENYFCDFRCNSWVLLRSCNEWFHNWSRGSNSMASWLSQQSRCSLCSS